MPTFVPPAAPEETQEREREVLRFLQENLAPDTAHDPSALPGKVLRMLAQKLPRKTLQAWMQRNPDHFTIIPGQGKSWTFVVRTSATGAGPVGAPGLPAPVVDSSDPAAVSPPPAATALPGSATPAGMAAQSWHNRREAEAAAAAAAAAPAVVAPAEATVADPAPVTTSYYGATVSGTSATGAEAAAVWSPEDTTAWTVLSVACA